MDPATIRQKKTGRPVRLSKTIHEKLSIGDFLSRMAYFGAIIDRVEVDDANVRIQGRKRVLLEHAALANGGPVPGIRSLIRNWRARKVEAANRYDCDCDRIFRGRTLFGGTGLLAVLKSLAGRRQASAE